VQRSPRIAITGASSFIGQHLVRHLLSLHEIEMRLLVHNRRPDLPAGNARISLTIGDLLKPDTLEGFLHPGCTVINLAYLGGAPAGDNLAAATNLADVCLQANVRRLVHCSTAVVAGRASDDVITEETRCEPGRDYELTKFKMEKLIMEKARGHFDLAILRPTAVFGPGGKNLLKLANDLMSGNRGLNYLKSCLFDHRLMNLVFVDHVVSALVFLAFAGQKRDCDVFIVSDDEHPMNNYRDVERYLIRALGRRDYPLPRISLPPPVLTTFLRLAGRSNSNSSRTYHAGKLREAGFEKNTSFEAGLASFADWYRRHRLRIRAVGNT
jgi:nucleoside-diphosphate-sugar epimerase